MHPSNFEQLSITPWAQLGKEHIHAKLYELNGLAGPEMLGEQWPTKSNLSEMIDFLHAQQAYALINEDTLEIYGGYGLRQDEHAVCWFYYYLFPSWRGKGLGQTLLRFIEKAAFIDMKCMTLRAHCNAENQASIKTLSNAGFALLQESSPTKRLLFIKANDKLKST
jgi:RimJ/RimL family protein N-acetyltransferase